MESDELYIKKTIGKRTPFTTPPDFLKNLQVSIVENIEEQNSRTHVKIWSIYRNYIATAACIVVIASAIVTICLDKISTNSITSHNLGKTMNIESLSYSDDSDVDYTMLDNDEIYSLVASN